MIMTMIIIMIIIMITSCSSSNSSSSSSSSSSSPFDTTRFDTTRFVFPQGRPERPRHRPQDDHPRAPARDQGGGGGRERGVPHGRLRHEQGVLLGGAPGEDRLRGHRREGRGQDGGGAGEGREAYIYIYIYVYTDIMYTHNI